MLTPELFEKIKIRYHCYQKLMRLEQPTPEENAICSELDPIDVSGVMIAEIDRLRGQAYERELTNKQLTMELVSSEQKLDIAVKALEYYYGWQDNGSRAHEALAKIGGEK